MFSVGIDRHIVHVYKYPCTKCLKPCKSNQSSVLCDICNLWTHQKCSLLSNKDFEMITDNSQLPYFCQQCCLEVFPFQKLNNTELIRLISENNVFFPIVSDRLVSVNSNTILQHKQYCDIADIKFIKNTFSVLFVNIRSLNHNFNHLEELVHSMKVKPAIIGVTETWLNQVRPFVHTLSGYNFVYYPSPHNSGGVGIFVLDRLTCTVIDEYKLNVNDCEDIWLKLNLPHKKSFVVGVVYRHPNYSIDEFQDKFSSQVLKLNSSHINFLIGGDFNIDLLKDSSAINNYHDLILSLGCFQTVNTATRFSSNFASSSLLDHMYTNLS